MTDPTAPFTVTSADVLPPDPPKSFVRVLAELIAAGCKPKVTGTGTFTPPVAAPEEPSDADRPG